SEWFNAAPSADVTASSEFRDKNGILYPARNVVDRQARVGGDSVIWIANEGDGATIELRWRTPIEAKQFILYNITSAPEKTILVQNSKILLYYSGIEVGSVSSTGPLSPHGTPVSIRPTKIDVARITITKSSGTITRKPLVGLAEVETIARIFSITSN
ncbi:MAG: hypothetical protein ABI623_09980, partial [bacterium]